MPDLLGQALATPGLVWVGVIAFVAASVRGFAGFGSAMIYLPVATPILGPAAAIITLSVMDCFGAAPAVPGARRDANWPDLRRLLGATAMLLPAGLWVLVSVPEEVFRVAVSVITLMMLIALIFGLRYRGRLSTGKTLATGAAAGFLGGAAGLPGPVVTLFYMASSHPAHVIRATILMYLVIWDILILGMMGVSGLLDLKALVIGACLTPVAALGTALGTALFDPARERLYRGVAYIIIAAAALRGLPIWG